MWDVVLPLLVGTVAACLVAGIGVVGLIQRRRAMAQPVARAFHMRFLAGACWFVAVCLLGDGLVMQGLGKIDGVGWLLCLALVFGFAGAGWACWRKR